jgi:hypothetical protein
MISSAWIASVVRFLRERRRQVAGAAVAVLAILTVAWWSGPPRGAPTLPKVDPTGPAARSHPVPKLFTALLERESPPPIAKDDGLCGYGPVPIVDDVPQVPADIQLAAYSALADLAASLARRSTERERALGLYFQRFAPSYGSCADDDKTCQFGAEEAARNTVAQSRRDLIRLATTTSDADVYALAIFSCPGEIGKPGKSESEDCALLSYAQWARIEPDNAVPWLYLASEAGRRRDSRALDAALYRASQAQYADPHQDQIPALIASDAMAALPPPIQSDLTITLSGIQATFPAPDLFLLLHYCGLDGQVDSNHMQTCGDLAATLIERDRSEIDGHFGTRIGEQLGWPAPRLANLRDEAEAMEWQMWERQKKRQREDLRRTYSCETLQWLRKNMLAQVQLGQSGRLRQDFAASGLKTSQAAEQWRAEKQRRLQLSQAQKPAQ